MSTFGLAAAETPPEKPKPGSGRRLCPICDTIVNNAIKICPKCNHFFRRGRKHKPKPKPKPEKSRTVVQSPPLSPPDPKPRPAEVLVPQPTQPPAAESPPNTDTADLRAADSTEDFRSSRDLVPDTPRHLDA